MIKTILCTALICLSATSTTVYDSSKEPLQEVKTAPRSIEQVILDAFPLDPIMVAVARAESGMRQFDKNGNVIINKQSNDVGIFQINVHYHGETAKKLGMDIYTLEGNIAYAQYLLKTQGLNAWIHSYKNWGSPDFIPHLARK